MLKGSVLVYDSFFLCPLPPITLASTFKNEPVRGIAMGFYPMPAFFNLIPP